MTVARALPCRHTQQDKQECKRPRDDCANTVCPARMPASHCSVRAANIHPGQTRASHLLEQKTSISRCGSVRPPQAHCPYFQNASDLPSSQAHCALSTCSSHSVFLQAFSLFLHSLPNPHEHLSHLRHKASAFITVTTVLATPFALPPVGWKLLESRVLFSLNFYSSYLA